jgi:signal transduction histidine kinase
VAGFELLVRRHQDRVFRPAGLAPTGPEIEQHVLPPEIAQRDRPAARVVLRKVRCLLARPHGTGSGLSLAKQILLRHGGRIKVQSTDEQGPVFRLEW